MLILSIICNRVFNYLSIDKIDPYKILSLENVNIEMQPIPNVTYIYIGKVLF